MNSKRQALLDLATRVEGLDGPSREVDAWIAASLIKDIPKLAALNTPKKWVKAAMQENWNIPRCTASLDAAMQLVPRGWTVANIGQGDDGLWWCELREGYLTSYNHVAISGYKINTAAQAVAASALRARAMMEDE